MLRARQAWSICFILPSVVPSGTPESLTGKQSGEVENYIRKLGLPVTVLRPAAFMENYYIAAVEIGILKGKLADPIRGDKAFQTMRLTTSAPSERWLLIGQMILSVSRWKLREASSPTFKRQKCSVACWGNELNFRRCLADRPLSSGERALSNVSLVQPIRISG
jgi:hypothetical protein